MGLFADGVAVKLVGEETFRICRELLDEIILVDTDAICAAIKDIFEDTRSIVEPAGAWRWPAPRLCRARGLRRSDAGGDFLWRQYEFRSSAPRVRAFRAGRAAGSRDRGDHPEKPGSFKRFCTVIGGRNITEFNYRFADPAPPMFSSACRSAASRIWKAFWPA